MNKLQLEIVQHTNKELLGLIAKQMLDFLEEQAKVSHFKVIKLETGAEQPEAISFYLKQGFVAIETFGEYVNCQSSLCFEKSVG